MITRERLEAARVADGRLARKRGELRPFGCGRMVRQLSVDAVMNAVNHEGREVLTAAGEEYFRDMDRLYFGVGGQMTCQHSMRNRLGRVLERTVYGRNGGKAVLKRA